MVVLTGEFSESASPLQPTVPLTNRRQYTVGDPARSLADTSDLCTRAARVYFDHLGASRDRNTVASQAPEHAVEGRRQDRRADLGDLLALAHLLAAGPRPIVSSASPR